MYSYEIAWCFHQSTCYTPSLPEDWDLEKFASNFYSFMVGYNVLDKVWLLLWGGLGQVLPSDLPRVTELEPVFSFRFYLVLPAFPIPQYFLLKIIQLGQDQLVHFKHLCFC